MGWAILKKFLIQFSVEGQGCIPSLLFDLRPNYGGGNEESGDLLQKVPCMLCLTQCPQTCCRHCQRLATADRRLCQRLLNTHPQVWVTLLWGHCSFLLGPGVYKVLFVPSKSLFPQSCVSSGHSVVGLMVTSSRRLMPHPGLLHPEPLPCGRPLLTCTSAGDTQTLKGRSNFNSIIRGHHRLNGHDFEQALGVGKGWGSLVCCSPWGLKELETTELLN